MLPKEGYDVVISGVGGKFPETNSIAELQEKLFAKEDLVTEPSRWPPGTYYSFIFFFYTEFLLTWYPLKIPSLQ